MIEYVLDKVKNIVSYKYDDSTSTFVVKSNSSVEVLKGLVSIVNILSEQKIQFIVDKKYNININVIDLEPKNAFVVSLDSEANIIDINDIALGISGYSRDELIGRNYFDFFIDNADKEVISKVFNSVLSGNNNYWKYQNNIVLKDGSKRFLKWSNALIKDEENDISTIHAFGV